MRVLLRIALTLYPRAWRRRYGRELEALVEDLDPSPRMFFDLLIGAVKMQIGTLKMMPLVGAAIGVACGVLVSSLAPDVYASSALIRLQTQNEDAASSQIQRDVELSLDDPLDRGVGTRSRTSLALVEADGEHMLLRLTYTADAANEALRVVQLLTQAFVHGTRSRAREILDPANQGTSARPEYATTTAFGAAIGLLAGAAVLLIVARRRRS
jgi:hypothetical protein